MPKNMSEKQKKLMSAISHGFKPTGKAADIPKSVAKKLHAESKGKYAPKKKGKK